MPSRTAAGLPRPDRSDLLDCGQSGSSDPGRHRLSVRRSGCEGGEKSHARGSHVGSAGRLFLGVRSDALESQVSSGEAVAAGGLGSQPATHPLLVGVVGRTEALVQESLLGAGSRPKGRALPRPGTARAGDAVAHALLHRLPAEHQPAMSTGQLGTLTPDEFRQGWGIDREIAGPGFLRPRAGTRRRRLRHGTHRPAR